MHSVHLASLDLNLLVALDALLTERHVTKAAKRVGLSQSAMSHSLSRIREVFGDPMLVRTHDAMHPTDRALALEPLLRRALGELSSALAGGGPAFDPKKSERSFTIGSTDYASIVFLPSLMARLRKEAPAVDIVFKTVIGDHFVPLGVGAVDLVIGPVQGSRPSPPGIVHEPLLVEQFRCVVRRDHPLTKKRLTVPRYIAYPHVMVAPHGEWGSFVDDALFKLGQRRRVACMVPHFLVAPLAVASTDLVLTMVERIVRRHTGHLGLVSLPVPLAIPDLTVSMVWHDRSSLEPGHRWLRDVLREIARDV